MGASFACLSARKVPMKAFSAAILAFVSMGAAASTLDVARATEVQLSAMAETVESYRADCGRLPSKAEFLELTRAEGGGCRSAHYLRTAQLSDHWKSEIVYEVRGDEFDLLSAGADRLRGTSDDIVYGVNEKPWRLIYRATIDPRDDLVDRWRNVIALVIAVAAAAAIAGWIQRRRSHRKS